MNGPKDDSGLGFALLGLTLLPLIVLIVVWLACAVVASMIADHRGRSGIGFFLATFFFLGPLGVGVALLAGREDHGFPVGPLDPPLTEKRKVVDGRRRFYCPRCGAENDILDADTSYDCWRCNEHRNVKAKAAPAKKS